VHRRSVAAPRTVEGGPDLVMRFPAPDAAGAGGGQPGQGAQAASTAQAGGANSPRTAPTARSAPPPLRETSPAILPDSERPEAWGDTEDSNDARLQADVPPHRGG
jgi:hypothetical protein